MGVGEAREVLPNRDTLKKNAQGFSLIELMIVLAIVAVLSMVSIPSFVRFLAKAKRTEAYINLRALYTAEKVYWVEHGVYTSLLGPDGLGWRPEGSLNYTYGFSGSEGRNYIVGQLKTPGSALHTAQIRSDGFTIAAAGDIDGDGTADVLTIDQTGTIKIVTDDLV